MSKLVAGAHVLCFFNKRLMGQVTAVDWDQATPRVRRHGLDALAPYEISPVGSFVSGSVGLLRVHGDGALEGRGLVAPAQQIPKEKYACMLLIDRENGKKLLQIDHLAVGSQKWKVGAKGRLEGSFSFEGILATNEFDLLS